MNNTKMHEPYKRIPLLFVENLLIKIKEKSEKKKKTCNWQLTHCQRLIFVSTLNDIRNRPKNIIPKKKRLIFYCFIQLFYFN